MKNRANLQFSHPARNLTYDKAPNLTEVYSNLKKIDSIQKLKSKLFTKGHNFG
jgi:hypothetical protein